MDVSNGRASDKDASDCHEVGVLVCVCLDVIELDVEVLVD